MNIGQGKQSTKTNDAIWLVLNANFICISATS